MNTPTKNEFNLHDERSKWCSKWIKFGRLSGRAIAELKQIDNELKEKLKEELCKELLEMEKDKCAVGNADYIPQTVIRDTIEKTFGGEE